MKIQTRILDNRLYYTRKIELHRKGKKSRTLRITPILICSLAAKSLVLITVRKVHYGKMGKAPTTKSKVGDSSWGRLEGSRFNSYFTDVRGRALTPFPGLLHFTLDTNLLNVSRTIFWIFVITRPGIELRSPGPLANTLPTRPYIYIYLLKDKIKLSKNSRLIFR